jgi:hypothetical protein
MPSRLLPALLTLALVLVVGACGDVTVLDNNLPPLPTITAFTATPAALDAGGGTTLLNWTTVNQDGLALQPGNHDVTGFTSAIETLSATTTYTLTAGNSLGAVSSSVTVTVGP